MNRSPMGKRLQWVSEHTWLNHIRLVVKIEYPVPGPPRAGNEATNGDRVFLGSQQAPSLSVTLHLSPIPTTGG